jgi:hypothetical protein
MRNGEATLPHVGWHVVLGPMAMARRWCIEISGIVMAAMPAEVFSYCDGWKSPAIPESAKRTGRVQLPAAQP